MTKSPADELQYVSSVGAKLPVLKDGGENAKPKSLLDIVVSTGTGLGSDGRGLGVLSSQRASRWLQ
jgi:hypothetical protein